MALLNEYLGRMEALKCTCRVTVVTLGDQWNAHVHSDLRAEYFPTASVANLWTEFAAHRSDALILNGKEPQTLINSWWLQLSKWQKLSLLPNL